MRRTPLPSFHRIALFSLIPLHLAVMGISQCGTPTDEDGDGWTVEDGDCNDHDPDIYPGAPERCDGMDNNCDGVVNEDLEDADGNGIPDCLEQVDADLDGFSVAQGDCDDADAGIHPGATDGIGDGIDSDCGGKDTPQPHVGLSSSSLSTLQAALNAAIEGDTVWVGPGTYKERRLSFAGKAVTFASTGGAAATVIDAQSNGPVMVFATREEGDTVVRGFTLAQGSAADGGCISAVQASPTLDQLIVRDCVSTDSGGGLYLSGSRAVISSCTFQRNRGYAGGGIFEDGGSPTIRDSSFYENEATGYMGQGGGVLLAGSSGSITGSTFSGNRATSGGGLAAYGATTRLEGCSFSGNEAYDAGGGLEVNGGSPVISSCNFLENRADSGGGAQVWEASPSFSSCTFRANEGWYGGGLYLYASAGTITDSVFTGHSGERGGAIMMSKGSSPALTGCRIAGNQVSRTGGAIDLSESSPTLTGCVLADNLAQGYGGAVYGEASSPAFTNCTLARNVAEYGGGLYLMGSSAPAKVRNCVLHRNVGYNLYQSGASVTVTYSDLYSTGPNHNLSGLDATNLTVDPRFVSDRNDGVAENDDYHLAPGSPLFDAGDPALEDGDGTRSDMGAYAGPGADRGYYADPDGDGLYSGWEAAHGLDPERADASADPDGDGAGNGEELEAHCDPHLADTDGDGASDGSELAAGSSPVDWYSQPGVAVATATVPDDFETIQGAILAVEGEGVIEVAAGTWRENLSIDGRTLTLRGPAGPAATRLEGTVESITGQAGSTIAVRWAKVTLQGLTVTGGSSQNGGGLYLVGSAGTLEDLWITGNTASYYGNGGGIFLSGSSPTLRNCWIGDNVNEGRQGGGMHLWSSSPLISNTVIEANRCVNGDGGGVQMRASSPTFTSCIIANNQAYLYGGGVDVDQGAAPVFRGCTITGNKATYTSGLLVTGGAAGIELTSSIVAYNLPWNLVIDDNRSVAKVRYNDVFNPESAGYDGPALDGTNLSLEPEFQALTGGVPSDLHLATTSPLIDRGDAGLEDPDGTRADMGVYGGPGGDGFDIDADGYSDYFWPGAWSDAPAGFSASGWDCDDRDSAAQRCEP